MKRSSRSGSSLLLVLWAVIVISLAVSGLAVMIQSDVSESGFLQNAFLARQAAESRVAIASHPHVTRDDPLLAPGSTAGVKWTTAMSSESARLNINRVLKEKRTDILIKLFSEWGLDASQVSQITSALEHWSQPATLDSLSPEENDYYRERFGTTELPRRPFQSVREMALVRGMDLVAQKKPDWENKFTVWTDGGLDLNEAPADLITAVLGDDRAQVAALVQQREKMRTSPVEDERSWFDLKTPLEILGVADDSPAAKFFTVGTSTWRIEASATVGTRTCVIGSVVSKKGQPSKTLYRYEL